MTTEDEATRLLKWADPARVDDGAPFVDAAGYLDALRTRSTTVTLIDPEPTPRSREAVTAGNDRRRRAAVVATSSATSSIRHAQR